MKGKARNKTKRAHAGGSTYIGVVPSHNVSDDDRSIFKFQLRERDRV